MSDVSPTHRFEFEEEPTSPSAAAQGTDIRMVDAPSPIADVLAHDHGLVDAHDFNNLLTRFEVLTTNHAALNVNVTKLTELFNTLLKSQVTGSIS